MLTRLHDQRLGLGFVDAGHLGQFVDGEVVPGPPFHLSDARLRSAAELVRRERRWGVRSWSTHAPWGPALARVAAAARS